MSAGEGHLEEEHEEHVNTEAWVIPYADMLTLLMALFMMLFAISSVDAEKFQKLAASVRAEFGGGAGLVDGGDSVLGGEELSAGVDVPTGPSRAERAEAALRREEQRQAAEAAAREQLDLVEEQVRREVEAAGVLDSVSFRREARGLVVSIVTDQVMFAPGDATVTEAGATILREVAEAVRPLPNRISIEGHTDDVPISTARFRSNWELSTARATEVLRYLVDQLGIPASRVQAAGYGEQQPIASNDTPEGRAKNRRVEIAILAELPEA